MLDKTRKIIYIITGTLTIISLVFMLMHKVGLCAQVSPPSYTSDFPLPYGPSSNIGYGSFPLTDEIIQGCISAAFDSSVGSYFSNGYSVTVYEIESNNAYITLSINGGDTIVDARSSFPELVSGCGVAFARYGVAEVRYTVSSGSYDVRYTGSSSSQKWCDFGNHLSALPTGGIALETGTFISGYPVAFSEGYNLIFDSVLVFGNPSSGYPLGGGSGEITTLPNLEDLTGSPSSGDTNDTLFSILKGWLSTINGNIKKGFTNIYDNISSFLQPYLERFKAITDIIENPEDFLFCSQERQQELLQGSQVYQDVQSLQGIGQNIFGILGATASEHVYWTFDFSDTVLDSCGVVQINFDWYDSIRNYVVPLFMAFFYVGMLLLIIRKIPGIISGASSNSDDK